MSDTVEKRIYIKVLIGFLCTLVSVFISVAINDFPPMVMNGPFKWVDLEKHPYPSIFIISLIVTVITALLQIEVETRLYAISSIINGYSFSETITSFVIDRSGSTKKVTQNLVASIDNDYLYIANNFSDNNSTLQSNNLIFIANILTFIAVASILLNLIFIIINFKIKSRRVRIKILTEKLNSSRDSYFENLLDENRE